MAKVFDNGDAETAADRERPALTHAPVDPAQTAAEQDRVPQNRTAPVADADTSDDGSDAEDGSQKKARRRSVKK